MRLEQRIGRVDRIGQRRRVHAFHLIAGGTGEARILSRLKERLAVANIDIGAADPLGSDAEDVNARLAMTGNLDDDDGDGDAPSRSRD
jgi:SNF2 family DNA or RNA helicase